LYLDDESDRQVRALWAAFDSASMPSLAAEPARFYRPHVSLYVADDIDVAALPETTLDRCLGLQLALGDITVVPRPPRPPAAALGVAGGPSLAEAQAAVAGALEPHATRPWPAYQPNAYVPRCTLTLNGTDLDGIAAIAATRASWLRAQVTEAHVVTVPDGTTVIARSLDRA
jgi:hypothetical protein